MILLFSYTPHKTAIYLATTIHSLERCLRTRSSAIDGAHAHIRYGQKWLRYDFTASSYVLKEAEDYIVKEDKALQLNKASKFCHLNAIADSVGWRKLWDLALDHGPSGIQSVKNLVRIISYPNHATNKCPKCEIAELDPLSLPAHIIDEHTNSGSYMGRSPQLSGQYGSHIHYSCVVSFKCVLDFHVASRIII